MDTPYDLRDEQIKDRCIVYRADMVRSDTISMRVMGIGSKICGISFKGQRPSRVLIKEPTINTQTELKQYINWLSKEVLTCASNDCEFTYGTNYTSTKFTGRKEFSEWLSRVRQC
jgi:hypothetical protein